MNEKPILFNTEMVQAILDGRKTQTRRSLPEWQKPKQINNPDFSHMQWMCTARNHPRWGFGVFGETEEAAVKNLAAALVCPFGNVGDRLWVRETWRYEDWTEDGQPFVRYKATGDVDLCWPPESWNERLQDAWEALSEAKNYNIKNRACDQKWRPSIHMPRWASRITLEITDVRVERLQDISEEDVKAEGFSGGRGHFTDTWIGIYGRESLDANHWVWVVEFKVIK